MATQPIHERFVPVEEYLSTAYEHDCEYDDGVIVERPLGEFEHSFLQVLIGSIFTNNMDAWGVFGLTEQRVQLNSRRFLVPDVCVLRVGAPTPRILTEPPLIAIELLSPEDTLRRTSKKCVEYLDFGVEHVWIVDPKTREAYLATESGFERVLDGVFAVPGTPIEIHLSELFAKMDRVRGTQI